MFGGPGQKQVEHTYIQEKAHVADRDIIFLIAYDGWKGYEPVLMIHQDTM